MHNKVWFVWGLAVCTVISTLAAFYFGINSLPSKSLAYHISDAQKISVPNDVDATVFIDGVEYSSLDDLLIYDFVLWNDGNTAIENSSIEEPIVLSISEGGKANVKIVDIVGNDDSIGIKLNDDNSRIEFGWDRILPNQAIKLQISGNLLRSDFSVQGAYLASSKIEQAHDANPPSYRILDLYTYERDGVKFESSWLVYLVRIATFSFFIFMIVFVTNENRMKKLLGTAWFDRITGLYLAAFSAVILFLVGFAVYQELGVFHSPPI